MVFLPAYKKHNTLGETADADGLADRTISFFTSAALVVAVLLYSFADAVVSVVAPGFAGETKSLCIRLVRISSPMNVFITAAAVYASMLESRGKFFASQIRQVASHIPTILAALLLYKSFGVTVLAWALVAGSLLRLLTELPFVDWGYKFRPVFGKKDKEFGQLLKRMPSALISEAVTQINTLVDKVMASGLSAGAISSLNYGSKLINVFSGLLSGAVSVSTYPQMVEFIAPEGLRKPVETGCKNHQYICCCDDTCFYRLHSVQK